MSRGFRLFTPPGSLTWLKAVAIASFIARPNSLAAPEKGAAIPNRISRSLMPRVVVPTAGAVGEVAAAAEEGAIAAATLGPEGDRSRSASCRSAIVQSIFPAVAGAWPYSQL